MVLLVNREVVFLRQDEDAPIDMVLVQDDVVVNLTGFTELALILTPQDGSQDLRYSTLDSSPAVSVISAIAGSVRFVPILQDLISGMTRLQGRWFVVLSSRKFYFPQEGFFMLNLVRDPSDEITFQTQVQADGYLVQYP